MGTLPIMKELIGLLLGSSTRLPASMMLVLVITLGVQVSEMSCSGGASLARPYLFRDFGMPVGQAPPPSKAHAQIANLYHFSQPRKSSPNQNQHHQRRASSQSTESSAEIYYDDRGSSEEDPGLEYTAPLILDIDDPERARWIGFTSFEQDDEYNDDLGDDGGDGDEEEGSISSTEFQSRSGAPAASTTDDDESSSGSQQDKSGEKTSSSRRSSDAEDGSKRGIMDYLPLVNFWGGEDEQGTGQTHQQGELPQDDLEMPFYDYQQYIYQPYGTYDYEQFYTPQVTDPQNDQKQPKPAMMMTQKPKSKPKPKPKPKQKPKPKPKPKPSMPRPKPMKIKVRRKRPNYSQQFHYQELEKPGKLERMKEKLAKLNPFRYVQIQKPKIKIEKIPEEMPPPRHPPPMKRPPMPMRMKRPRPPMMMMRPKGQKPRPMQKMKPKQKPQGDESNPEFVMIFGEPSSFGGGYSSDDQGEYSQEEDTQYDNDEEEDDNDEDEDEEEDDEYGNEEDGPVAIVHGSEADNEETLSDDETIVLEDDEADYSGYTSEGGISPVGAKRANEDGEQVQDQVPTEEADEKEKSILGFRKKKRRRRPHKRPARRPPHWKDYRPAPLLPEFPEKLSDALLTVVKNVGFLPEYGKEEKYGGHHGHNKIKGKFTKTRPITLHHGLLTEVLRRK